LADLQQQTYVDKKSNSKKQGTVMPMPFEEEIKEEEPVAPNERQKNSMRIG